MNGKIDGVVREIYLQFSFSNRKLVPSWIPSIDCEKGEERKTRKGRVGRGTQFITPTPGVSLLDFVCDLEQEGFRLVDAVYQMRVDEKKSQWKNDSQHHGAMYCMVRFIFSRNYEISESYEEILRDKMRPALVLICQQALWRVRAYHNPWFENGETTSESLMMSVNAEVRDPLFQEGRKIMVWKRDDKGEKVGDSPEPKMPKGVLRVVGGEIKLI